MRKRKPGTPPAALKPPPRSVMKPPPLSTPKPPPQGKVPNPKRPRIVIGGDGGELGNLFALFPELPWPTRSRRFAVRTLAGRLRRFVSRPR